MPNINNNSTTSTADETNTGEVVPLRPRLSGRLADSITTSGAAFFILLSLSVVYTHRANERLIGHPEPSGIAFTQTRPTPRVGQSELLQRLGSRLEGLRERAYQSGQVAAHHIMVRRLERLQSLIGPSVADATERVYVERRLTEFDQDLALLEQDLGSGTTQ